MSKTLPDEFWSLVENLRCQRTGDPVDSAHTKLEEYVQDLIHAERKAATAEAKVSVDRLAEILRRTANAIRGEPPESIAWGWKDLPERAAALATQFGSVRGERISVDDQRLVLWRAIQRITYGNKTDEKLILAELHKAGFFIIKEKQP